MTITNKFEMNGVVSQTLLRKNVLEQANSISSSVKDFEQILQDKVWCNDSGILHAIAHNQHADLGTLLAVAEKECAMRGTLSHIMDRVCDDSNSSDKYEQHINIILAVAVHKNTSKAVLDYIRRNFPVNTRMLLAVASNPRASQKVWQFVTQNPNISTETLKLIAQKSVNPLALLVVARHPHADQAVRQAIVENNMANTEVLKLIMRKPINVYTLLEIVTHPCADQEIWQFVTQNQDINTETLKLIAQKSTNPLLLSVVARHPHADQEVYQVIINSQQNAEVYLAIAEYGAVDTDIFNKLIKKIGDNNINLLLMAIAKNQRVCLEILKTLVGEYTVSSDILIKIINHTNIYSDSIKYIDNGLLRLIMQNQSCDEAVLLELILRVNLAYMHGNKLLSVLIEHSCTTKLVLTSLLNKASRITDENIIKLIVNSKYADDDVLSMLEQHCNYKQKELLNMKDPIEQEENVTRFYGYM